MSASDVKNEHFLAEFKKCLDQHKTSWLLEQSSTQKLLLGKSKLEVEPRMILHSRDGFYDGEREKTAEYHPIAEFGGFQKTHDDVVMITSKDFYRTAEGDKRRGNRQLRVTLVGPAGSGKTTLLKRFARDATDGAIPQIQETDRVVHVLDCRVFKETDDLTVPDFFFKGMGGFKPTEKAIKVGYAWMLKNPERVTLIVDGLDTLRFTLKNKDSIVQPDDSASPAKIFYNIFTGHLFKESRVLSSSREFAIRTHKDALRADRVVSLAGLSQESIRKLTVEYVGEERSREVLRIMENTCPGLKELCETPVFLIFTLIGLHEKEQGRVFIPTTMSGVMINLLKWLLHSEHSRRPESGDVMSIINKMKELSWLGMRKGKVLFTEKDLFRVGLIPNDLSDLAIIVPGKKVRFQQLLEVGSVTYFAHQTIQEILCALKIIEMELKEFKKFAMDSIHYPQYIVIRRMVSGVLLNTQVFIEAQVLLAAQSDIEEKRAILKQSLSRQFPRVLSQDNLQLLHLVHESGDGGSDIIPEQTNTIDLSTMPLMTSDVLALGTSLSHRTNTKKVDISGCNLSDASIEVFAERTQNGKVKVRRFYVSKNSNVSKTGLRTLGRVIRNCEVEKFDLSLCELTSEKIDAFTDGLGNAKVKKININSDPSSATPKVTMSSLRKLIPKVTKRLDLVNIDFTPQEKAAIQDTLDQHQADLKINLGMDGQKEKMFPRRRGEKMQEIVEVSPQPSSAAEGAIDERHMEIMGTKSPTPEPEDEISAESEKNANLETVQLDESVQKDLEVLVGPEGDCIRPGEDESTITFPKNAFEKETKVKASQMSKASDWPKHFSRIAPIIECDVSGVVLLQEAEIKLKTWCVVDKDDVLACVLVQEMNGSAWKLDQCVSIDRGGYVTFKTKTFSKWSAAVYNCASSVFLYLQRRLNTFMSYRLVNLAYYDNQANVVCVVCVEAKVEEKKKELKAANYQPLLPCQIPILSKTGSRIEVSLECKKPEGCSTGEPRPVHIFFTDRIVDAQSDQVFFKIDPPPSPDHKHLEIDYSLEADRPEKHLVRVIWPPANADNHGNDGTYHLHLKGAQVGSIIIQPKGCEITGGQP